MYLGENRRWVSLTKPKSLLTICSTPEDAGCQVGGLIHLVAIALMNAHIAGHIACLLYTSPSPRDGLLSRMPSSA